AISAWAYELKPGDWTVTANLVARRTAASSLEPHMRRSTEADPLPVASWSWLRWSLSVGAAAPVRTRALLAPLARTPAVIPGVYTSLAVIAIVVALATQAAVLAAEEVPVGPSLLASLLSL